MGGRPIVTKEFENLIKSDYEKLRELAERDGIYQALEVLFTDKPPVDYQGDYAYTINGNYYLRATERDRDVLVVKTDKYTEVAYIILKSAVVGMTFIYGGSDKLINKSDRLVRRILFKKQLKLLEAIDIDYRIRRKAEIEEILKKHPLF